MLAPRPAAARAEGDLRPWWRAPGWRNNKYGLTVQEHVSADLAARFPDGEPQHRLRPHSPSV